MGRGDLGVVREIVADGFINHSDPSAGRGPESIIGTFEAIRAVAPTYRFIIEHLIAEDDLVAVHGRGITGPRRGSYCGQDLTAICGTGPHDTWSTAMTTLDDVKSFAASLSPWAHVASVGADGEPDVTPVHPCWDGDVLWTMCGTDSVKARNVRDNPKVALHWQVTEVGDGVELWGIAEVFDDLDTKRRLWEGVFDYDLDLFSPGGPDDSPGTAFMAIHPTRALLIRQYGMGGMERWRA